MFWKRNFNSFATLLLMIIILCAGTYAVIGQDSKAAAGDTRPSGRMAPLMTWTTQVVGASVSMASR